MKPLDSRWQVLCPKASAPLTLKTADSRYTFGQRVAWFAPRFAVFMDFYH